MQIVYSDFKITDKHVAPETKSIFAVGPTPRSDTVQTWRTELVEILKDLNYGGVLFAPEWSNFSRQVDYNTQVEWEKKGLTSSTAILCWVPRKAPEMPAYTTNVEFGHWVSSGKLFYGRPDDSQRNTYLDWMYKDQTGRDHKNDLRELVKEVLDFVDKKVTI